MSTENNAVAPVAAKAPSKMEQARVIFNELIATEKDGKIPEGSSRRKEFIRRATQEIQPVLTKNGAITYYNNLQNEAKGNPLYIKPKKAATVGQVQGAESQIELTEEQKEADRLANAQLRDAESAAPEVEASSEEGDEKAE